MTSRSAKTASASRRWGPALLIVGMTCGAVQMACTDRSRAFNAKLRDRIHELEEQNRDLELRNEELQVHLSTSDAGPEAMQVQDHAAIPLVTAIAIDGSSGRRKTPDRDGQRPLEVHVMAVDGRNRPIQLAGTMRVQVTRVTQEQPPVELAAVVLAPVEVREAWRRGLMGGATWLVSIPLRDEDLPPGTVSLDVDVFYVDLRTGQELSCGDKVDIR